MFKKLGILSLVVVASMGLNAEEATKYEGRLEETVVTTTGFEDNQTNQIKTVTIVTKEDIQNKGYNNVEDILRNAPGVNFVNDGFGIVADIRGQGSEEANKRVKVLIDGVQLNILDTSHGLVPINTIPVEKIQKIEIINGGGSVLYGSGTAGGVINIITKGEQEKDVVGKLYYQNSSFDTNKFGATAGIKMADNILVDLGYENINGRGYREKDKISSNALSAGILWKLSENQSLKLKVRRYDEETFNTNSLTLKQILENRKQAGSIETTEGVLKRKEYVLDYDFQPTKKLKFNLKGYKTSNDRKYDRKSELVLTDGLFKDDKLGIDLKGEYNYGSGTLVFGYDYLDNDAKRQALNTYNIVTPRGTMKMGSNTYIDLAKKTNSLFLLNRHSLTDKLDGTLGYRYEHSKYDIKRNAFSVRNGVATPAGSIDAQKTGTNHAYEGGLNFKYSNTGNIYGKYERGFRSPSPTELVDKVNNVYILNNVKPETYDTFEVGIKDMLWNSFFNVTLFHTKTNDEIYTIMSGGHGRAWTVENIQETKRTGAEVFLEQYLGKFRLNESISYVDAKVSKGTRKGNKIPYVPKVKATLGVVYDVIPELSLKADVNYYSSAVDKGNYKVNSYTTTNLGLDYKHSSGFGLQTGIKNIFNRKYYTYQSAFENSYVPAAERTYYIGVSYDF